VPESDSWSDDAEDPEIEVLPDDQEDLPGLPRMGSFEVMNRTIDIAQSALARHTLAAYPADLLIEVPRTTCRSLEFHRAVEVIAAGRSLAMRALDALESDDSEAGEPATPAIEG
jgi:NTE family protein